MASPFNLEDSVFFHLTQVMGSRDLQLTRALRGKGVRVSEWRVLAALRARRNLSMTDLADLTSIDRTTLTRSVDRMAASGWVMRLEDVADLRVTRLALTAKGEGLFAQAWAVVDALNRAAIAGLPKAMVDLALLTLDQIKKNLDAAKDVQDFETRRA